MDQYLSDSGYRVRVRRLSANAVRITHLPAGETTHIDCPWLDQVLLPQPEQITGKLELILDLLGGCVQVRTSKGLLFSEAQPPRLGLKRWAPYLSLDIPRLELRAGLQRVKQGVHLSLVTTRDEAFYGWGEWFNAFRRTAGSLRLRIRDAIAMLQRRETYSAIPLFYSSRGYAFWLLNSHTSRWRINPRNGRLDIEADGPGADYILIYGPSFKRILETYSVLTGSPPLLPRWAFGLWATSYPQGHQEEVLEHVRQHRQRQIPLDAVILDYHWEEGFHTFRWRRSLFPEPGQFIARLKELGLRLGLIITPFLNQRQRPFQKKLLNALAHNLPLGLEGDDERALLEYEEAKARGYLAHEDARWWFGVGGMPDFANPAAATWWNEKMRPLYEQGISFFKNDDGEYLPDDAHSASGMDGREYHNLYGFFYGKALYEGCSKVGAKSAGDLPYRPLIYARSVWAGSQRYPALFLGDQKPTYTGIRSTLRAGLNLSMLGFAYWTADVFGLDGRTTEEMHMRYAQWALLVPVARYFYRPPRVDDTRFPWSHGAQAEANFRKYTELRYRLLPYYTALGWQAYQSGLPVMRPLALEFQDQADLAGVDDQVMLGENLMLCPVVEAGAMQRRIALPPGVWHDFWSQQSWMGGLTSQIDYPAPMDRLPILVRGGTILPLGPVLQNISDSHRFDQLQLHLWPPYPAEGWLFDDDGCTQAYQKGAFSRTHITAKSILGGLVIRIDAAQGSFPEQVRERQVELVIHRCAAPLKVTVNRRETEDWSYEASLGQASVRFMCPVRKAVSVELRFALPQAS